MNLVHGSDGPDAAKREIALYFRDDESVRTSRRSRRGSGRATKAKPQAAGSDQDESARGKVGSGIVVVFSICERMVSAGWYFGSDSSGNLAVDCPIQCDSTLIRFFRDLGEELFDRSGVIIEPEFGWRRELKFGPGSVEPFFVLCAGRKCPFRT